VGFLGGCTQKTHRVFWVRTRVSEPWSLVLETELNSMISNHQPIRCRATALTGHS